MLIRIGGLKLDGWWAGIAPAACSLFKEGATLELWAFRN